ncbi:MAG: VOC family protein [Tissierellia bacterium]|nr:VOC family protein [Tissierellia bacterium]
MKLSHILYKVNDVEEAIKDFEEMGFSICRVGFNPKIWFEDETFIELFKFDKSNFTIGLTKLIGLRGIGKKFEFFRDSDFGIMEYSLEKDHYDLDPENRLLKEMGYKYTSIKMKKNDESGVKLKWKITFPYDVNIPFYCAIGNFKELGMPKEINHKNGARRIEKLVWGVDKKYIDDIKALYDDERLELVEGNGFQEIKIKGYDGDVFNRKYYK